MEPLQSPLIVIESPFRAKTKAGERKNLKYARECLKHAIDNGEIPIASHLLYPQVLDDSEPCERTLGVVMGLMWGCHADYIVVYEDLGISEGMQKAIKFWDKKEKHIIYRRIYAEG